MKRKDKDIIIEKLTEKINNSNHFYLTDIANLNAVDTSNLRRECFKSNIELMVVKNTLLQKAFERSNKQLEELNQVLAYSTSIMFAETGNAPARLIKEIRKTKERPTVKGAYVEECVYIGDNQLDNLASIKTKNELIGDIVGMLQSPIKNVVSALQSSGNKIAGIVKTLQEKSEQE